MTRKTRAHKKSQSWMRAHNDDPYVQRARQEGWRTRASFKLSEIDQQYRLLRPGQTVIDLGAAPGGWSQYAVKRIQPGGKLIALDRIEIKPIPDVEILCGDFCQTETLADLRDMLAERKVNLVLSDMAPNLTGIRITDQARATELIWHVLDFCREYLDTGGNLLAKVFIGSEFQEIKSAMADIFTATRIIKPAASRNRSSETFILATSKR